MHKITRFRHRRKAQLVELLGGLCTNKDCWETKNLEFDHIDPNKKSFELSGNNLNWAWDKLVIESAKCQLLCKKHHKEKTSIDLMAKHGTPARYNHRIKPCRCKLCIQAQSVYKKGWRKRRKEAGLIVW